MIRAAGVKIAEKVGVKVHTLKCGFSTTDSQTGISQLEFDDCI